MFTRQLHRKKQQDLSRSLNWPLPLRSTTLHARSSEKNHTSSLQSFHRLVKHKALGPESAQRRLDSGPLDGFSKCNECINI